MDPKTGLVASVRPPKFARSLAGPLFEPLVIEDTADSWGTGHGRYRKIVGRFKPVGRPFFVERGPIRTILRSVFGYRSSRVVMDVVSYPAWPVLEFRFRVAWNEERRRLKLRLPTALSAPALLAEVPAGAIARPADGEEHVHGRWLVVEGRSGGRAAAIGLASSGQHGLDFKDGEVRLSVLRSSAYCHERGFDLGTGTPKTGTRASSRSPHGWTFADLGTHEFKLLLTAGPPAAVRAMISGLADHLAAPPAAYAHLPYEASRVSTAETLISLRPSSIRLLACKRSWKGPALIVRLQETVGKKTAAELEIARPAGTEGQIDAGTADPGIEGGHVRSGHVRLMFTPFEIKTLRVERDGSWRAVRMVEED